MSSEEEKDNKFGSIVIYESEDGETNINVRFEDETVYLNQEQLCILYSTSKSNVSEQIIYLKKKNLMKIQQFGFFPNNCL